MRALLLLLLLVAPCRAQVSFPAYRGVVYLVPGSIGYQLRTGYPPDNMPPQNWYNFSTAYFELARLNPQAADEYGRVPVDRAIDLYPGMLDRLSLERRFLQQRLYQQNTFANIRRVFQR